MTKTNKHISCKKIAAAVLAALLLASPYPPGEAVFAKEPLTGTDSVAAVAANGRYGTFEHSLTLTPGALYCYRLSISNLDSKASQRYIYVQLPRFFQNQPEEYTPKLVKIKNLPKAKNDDTVSVLKNYKDFSIQPDGQLPLGDFSYNGSLETASVIKLDLSGMIFQKGTADICFILQAPEYEGLPTQLNPSLHSFYIYENSSSGYTLASKSEQLSRVSYATLTDAHLLLDGQESPEPVMELNPGETYHYRITVKRPGRQDAANRMLLVALPAFYKNLGEDSTPCLSQTQGLTITGLETGLPPLAFSTKGQLGSLGDPVWHPFTEAALDEYTPQVALMKLDLSSSVFTDEEAYFDFCFQTPDYPSLDFYPQDSSKKDTAFHGYALYEYDRNGDLLHKTSLEEGTRQARIRQNPLIMPYAPFTINAEDGLSRWDEDVSGSVLEGTGSGSRRIETAPGEEYQYQISIERPDIPEGYESALYILFPGQPAGGELGAGPGGLGRPLWTKETIAVGLDWEGAVAFTSESIAESMGLLDSLNRLKDSVLWTEDGNLLGEAVQGIRLDLNKARFTGAAAKIFLTFTAPDCKEESVFRHNFLLTVTEPQGETYVAAKEWSDRVQAAVLPAPPGEAALAVQDWEVGGVMFARAFAGAVVTDEIPVPGVFPVEEDALLAENILIYDDLYGDYYDDYDAYEGGLLGLSQGLAEENAVGWGNSAETKNVDREAGLPKAENASQAGSRSTNAAPWQAVASPVPPPEAMAPAAVPISEEEPHSPDKNNPGTGNKTPNFALFVFMLVTEWICVRRAEKLYRSGA